MNDEYYCPNCGLKHRLVKHDTPETWVRCISCGFRFQIKTAPTESALTREGDRPL